MRKIKEIDIPKWAMKHLLQWVEKAYRRGFQQGLYAAEVRGMKYNDKKVLNFRFSKCNNASEPLNKFVKCDLESRHLEWDKIPGVYTLINPKSITIGEE